MPRTDRSTHTTRGSSEGSPCGTTWTLSRCASLSPWERQPPEAARSLLPKMTEIAFGTLTGETTNHAATVPWQVLDRERRWTVRHPTFHAKKTKPASSRDSSMRQTCIFTRLQRWKPSRATTTATVACVPHDAHLETNGRHEERPATDSRKRWSLIASQRAAAHKDTFLSPTFGSLRRIWKANHPAAHLRRYQDLTPSPLGCGRCRGVGMDGQRTMAKSFLIGMSRVRPVSSQRFGALRSLLSPSFSQHLSKGQALNPPTERTSHTRCVVRAHPLPTLTRI